MEAVVRYVTAPATVIGDIGDLLSERHALEKSKKRKRKIRDSAEARTKSILYKGSDLTCTK